MSFTPEQTALLAAKLDRANVKERTMAGRKISYVEGWHVIAEANRIFGFDGWTSETVLLQETNRELVTIENDRGSYKQWRIGYIAKVRITAGGVSREGTGYGSGMGKPEAVGDAVEGAIKESETDARKRALMTFGSPFGLALYDKDQAEVIAASKPPKPSVTPSNQPGGNTYAPEHVKVSENQSHMAALTPEVWLKNSALDVKVMARAELDDFCSKQADRMARIRTLNPGPHAALVAAIRNRYEALG